MRCPACHTRALTSYAPFVWAAGMATAGLICALQLYSIHIVDVVDIKTATIFGLGFTGVGGSIATIGMFVALRGVQRLASSDRSAVPLAVAAGATAGPYRSGHDAH